MCNNHMKLYRVTNGFIGDSTVHLLVIAKNSDMALQIAKEKYKVESELYGERYYQNLESECLTDNTSGHWVSEIYD